MRGVQFGAALALAFSIAAAALAQPLTSSLGFLEFEFTPADSAQIALWVEHADGRFVATLGLTEAVAKRGIGNRPGASQMNSGFRWPYGRREGALPVWAQRRATAPGAQQFRRVIFQNRTTEGLASRTSNDQSRDDYYCLSFDRARSTKDALDAVSCASVFSSDKGRFLTEADVAAGYAEPYEQPDSLMPLMRPLALFSPYPPRIDVTRCEAATCYDHPDVAQFAAHTREVMPEIDAITMATPVGGSAQVALFSVPPEWEPGEYRACMEINVEGDYNGAFNETSFPTPVNPTAASGWWDSWALSYGYPYRGQPSVVYCTDFDIGGSEAQTFTTATPAGSAASWNYEDPAYGLLGSMDGMTDDPVAAPGSGADRLQLMDDGYRLKLVVKPPLSCMMDAPPSAVSELQVEEYRDEINAHQWVHLRFRAADDDQGIFRYEVRFSTEPIVDEQSFMSAMLAREATLEAAALQIPTDAEAGEMVEIDMGGLVQETHYYVAVRAMDACTGVGPISSAEITTPARVFTTVTPCFVATAAHGSALAREVGTLRRLRDRHLLSNDLGRALVSAYYAAGPALADLIRERNGLRSVARIALTPVVELASWLDR